MQAVYILFLYNENACFISLFYYNDISYMTDGSGIDHRSIINQMKKPTVWAKKPGVCAGSFFGGIYERIRIKVWL